MPRPGKTIRTLTGPGLPLLAGLWCLAPGLPTAERCEFRVHWREQVVGHVKASREVVQGTTHYRMTSWSEFDLIWKREVHSDLHTRYTGDRLSHCTSWVRVNGALRDSSHMTVGRPGCYVHPRAVPACAAGAPWATARLYFAEPVGQGAIFVESLLADRPLQALGGGRYRLSFPGGHANTYVYDDGRLLEVHVDRGLFQLVFRRR
ncbi:MAG: hypothetical protein RBT71_02740 [Flavobacteriales bacterium]|jgi:hypothetical protein|nr:hypothetical protein [Flavobacteriales bacterium]